MAKRSRSVRRRGAVATISCVIGAVLVAALLPPVAPAAAEDQPPPMFACTDAVTATPEEQSAFATRWADRLLGQAPGFDLQAYVDSAAAGEPLPDPIGGEVGFTDATDDTLTRGCLVTRLAEELALRDPTFGMDTTVDPPVPFAPDTVKSMLAMVVFHNTTETTPSSNQHGVPLDLPDPVTDALNALGLNQLLDVAVPAIEIPGGLGVPTPVSALISDLARLVQGDGLPHLPDLGGLVQLPALPIELPTLPTLPSLTDLVNLVRSVIDATSYTVCYTGDKTNGEKCTTAPLGLPVLLDVQGDALPDLRAHLLPTVAPAYPTGLSVQFSVERTGLSLLNPPPVRADVIATWDLPAANARAHVGFLSRFEPGLTLARRAAITATVESLSDATQGNPSIPFTITQQTPSSKSQVVAGISKLLRSAESGAVTVPESTIANLGFEPVPQTTTGKIVIQTTNAGPNQVRYLADLATSVPTKLTMNLLRDYSPAEPTAPCCPLQRFTAVADKLPSSISLDILKHELTNQWTVGYTGNAPVANLSLEGADYPTAASYSLPVTEQTVSAFSAAVAQVPTKVDVVALLPADGANPRTVDVSYAGSDASDPNAVVVVPSVDLGTITRVGGDVQRSFAGHAEQVPGRMHVVATLAGDALDTPAGDNLDVDLVYDASSEAQNLTVDFFDKGTTSTSKLHGSIASLPPWFHVNVGSHPTTTSVAFNAKTAPDAQDGSAALGTVDLKYAKNAEFLDLRATTPATEQYAVVKTTNGTDGQADTDDDGTAVEAHYSGLKRTAVSLTDDGLPKGNLDLHAKVVNDATRAMTARFDSPDSNVDAVVTDVPEDIDVTYQRRLTGTVDPECGSPENTHKVVYDAASTIDRAIVRVEGKTGGVVDPNNLVVVNAGRDPATNGEPIPKHLELFANSQTKRVAYRADGPVGQVAASILDAAPTCGNRKGINVDLRGLPTSFGASMDPEHLRFADLVDAVTPVDLVALDENKPVATALRSVAVAFTDSPTGAVPGLPLANELTVTSDKRGAGSITAGIRLAGVELFKLDLNHENPLDPDSKVVGVVTDLQLAAALSGVGTNLDFVGEDGEQARVRGAIGTLTPDLHLDLGLRDGDTQVHYDTPGGNMDVNLEIALGTAGQLDTVTLPTTLPIGVTMRDSQTCTCAKKIGIFMLGAPSSLDLHIDRITTATRQPGEQDFLLFDGYAPQGGTSDLSVDVALTNDADATKNLVIKVVLHAVPTGYGIVMAPIATGVEGDDAPTYFDLLVKGTKPVGQVDVDVAAGVPDTTDGSVPCSACKLHLTGTISNLPPGFQYHLEAAPSPANDGRKVTDIEIRQLGASGELDLSQTINSVNLNVLMWQLLPGSQTVRTTPQVQASINQVPSHVVISIADSGLKDDSIAQICARPDNALPKLTFTADGANRDSMDINATIDFVMVSDDPKAVDPDAAVLDIGATDLSRSVKFENTVDGKFIVSQPDPTAPRTGKVHLEVSDQTLKIFNWSFLPRDAGGCGFSGTIGPLTISTEGGLAFNLRTGLVLDIDGLKNVTLEPGVLIGVEGDFDNLTFGLRNPRLSDLYVSGIGLRFKVRISDSIQPSIPIVYPPISIGGPDAPVPPIPISIDLVDLSVNSRGNWIDVNLLVPCDVDVSWDDVDIDSFHIGVDTLPGLFAPFANGFSTTDNAKFLVLPFGDFITSGLRLFVDPIMIAVLQIFEGRGSFDPYIRCPD